MSSQYGRCSVRVIAILIIGFVLSACTTSHDPYHPRIYREVNGGYLAGTSCGGYRRGCCGGGGHCGAAYASYPSSGYPRRVPYYDRARIQPYPYPAYGRRNPGYGRPYYPGYGRPYSPYGGSVRVAGPYGAESRSAYYGPYGSVRSGTSARFY